MNEIKAVTNPSELEWVEGDLPPVHTVPRNACVLVWFVHNITQEEHQRITNMCLHHPNMIPPGPEYNGRLRRISMCFPKEDSLNPLKWCDAHGMPIGSQEKVAFYAWVSK